MKIRQVSDLSCFSELGHSLQTDSSVNVRSASQNEVSIQFNTAGLTTMAVSIIVDHWIQDELDLIRQVEVKG